MDSECEATIASISCCISVLLGDLTQPGTPAIVLKLVSSWEKLKLYFLNLPQGDTSLQLPVYKQVEQQGRVSTDSSVGTVGEGTDTECEMQALVAVDTVGSDTEPVDIDKATQLTSNSESNRQGLALESHETESSGLLLVNTS